MLKFIQQDCGGRSDITGLEPLPYKVFIAFSGIFTEIASLSFSENIPESAASATRGVVGAEQWETFEVLWDKESAYACWDLDGKTTAMR